MNVSDRHLVLTDLLLGAVYADERLEGVEEEAVKRLMMGVLEVEELPEEITGRIDNFDHEDFDLEAAAEEFSDDTDERKRRLLELVAAVFAADGEVDFDEDEYLRELAEALGMDESEWSDLALEYEVEDITEVASHVVSLPPPVPE